MDTSIRHRRDILCSESALATSGHLSQIKVGEGDLDCHTRFRNQQRAGSLDGRGAGEGSYEKEGLVL